MRISMAKGTETDEFVVLSKVRTGLKREFAFALKSQNEIAGSLGRTRTRKPVNGLDGVEEPPSSKRIKKSVPVSRKNAKKDAAEGVNVDIETLPVAGGVDVSGKGENVGKLVVESEGDLKSDVVDAVSDDDYKSHAVESLRTENNTDLMVNTSNHERKCVSDDSKCNGVIPLSDVEMEEVMETSIGQPQTFAFVNNRNEELQDLPGKEEEEGFVTPDKPKKRFTRATLNPSSEEANDLPTTGVTGGGDSKPSGNSLIATKVDKLSSKSSVKVVPRRLKDLLDTGLLEGLSVRYSRGVKHKLPKEIGLQGVISGSGILCYCRNCKGMNVATPSVFEIHAGSSNKRPPDYMYMDNGNTLRDVLNACKLCKLDDLEATIRKAIGLTAAVKSLYCINCKGTDVKCIFEALRFFFVLWLFSLLLSNAIGSMSVAGKGRKMLLCDACFATKAPEETLKKVNKACERPAEKLVHKSSDNAKKSSALLNKSQGRLTRKDLRLHKLVFEDDVLPDGTEVGYYVRGKKILSGYKQGSGILCSCCQKEVSPSQFEAHAGWASRRKPYLHIYTSNGVSLHELSVSLSRTVRFSTLENDDLCSICCQPGNLLCCDGCPRSFHKECIPLLEVPEDTWYCRYCSDNFQMEKFAERNANAIAAGRVAGVDPIEEIIAHRCIRIVKTEDQESDSGGCALCRSGYAARLYIFLLSVTGDGSQLRAHDFAKGGFSRRTVMLCDQCEREFHVGCLQDHAMQDLKELPEGKWFCSSGCSRINSALQQLIEDADQQVPDCLLNMIKLKHAVNSHEDVNVDIKWRLLSGKMSAVGNTRALLSKAVSVFHLLSNLRFFELTVNSIFLSPQEQFDPIVLPHSNQDMIPHMVYGRNVKDKEFGGMYCAVLTVNSVIVSVGIFRVLGKDIAELPLVATASGHEKLGYFQALYSCIERLLKELDVKHLWLPAADEAKPLWTSRFGFSEFPRDEFVELKKRFALMIFDGTCALRKPISEEHVVSDLHGGAMQTDHVDPTGIVSMDDAIKALAGLSDVAVESSVNPTGAPKGGEVGLPKVGLIPASQRSLDDDKTQDAGEFLGNVEALKDGDSGASIADIALQLTKMSPDCGKDTQIKVVDSVGENSMEFEVGVLTEVLVTQVDALQASEISQEDGKSAVNRNAMEVEVAMLKEEDVTQEEALQDLGMPQDDGKQDGGENLMEVEVVVLNEVGVTQGDAVQSYGILQDDVKQAVSENAMEVEVLVDGDGAKASIGLPDSENGGEMLRSGEH
ncbi:hypothetical protein V2J09_000039 [Rumex salicifolius]